MSNENKQHLKCATKRTFDSLNEDARELAGEPKRTKHHLCEDDARLSVNFIQLSSEQNFLQVNFEEHSKKSSSLQDG